VNSYEWCGEATYESSGYIWLEQMSQNYPAPIFFSETGCNVGGERTFDDQKAVFGIMKDAFSGAIIYEWVQETNNYGLVNYPNGEIYSGAPIPIQPDFDNVQKQWKLVGEVKGVRESDYSPTTIIPRCPEPNLAWVVDGDVPLPRVDPMSVDAIASSGLFNHKVDLARSIQTKVSRADSARSPPIMPQHHEAVTQTMMYYPKATTIMEPSFTAEAMVPHGGMGSGPHGKSLQSQASHSCLIIADLPAVAS
jgi:hypothetical protein